MEITKHQANMLRALADKKTLQFRKKGTEGSYSVVHSIFSLLTFIESDDYEVRIKPDVIVVNGIEVPAPEKARLQFGEDYYIAVSTEERGWAQFTWHDDGDDKRFLRLQILHKTPEAAGAHGRAMRAHKQG